MRSESTVESDAVGDVPTLDPGFVSDQFEAMQEQIDETVDVQTVEGPLGGPEVIRTQPPSPIGKTADEFRTEFSEYSKYRRYTDPDCFACAGGFWITLGYPGPNSPETPADEAHYILAGGPGDTGGPALTGELFDAFVAAAGCEVVGIEEIDPLLAGSPGLYLCK